MHTLIDAFLVHFCVEEITVASVERKIMVVHVISALKLFSAPKTDVNSVSATGLHLHTQFQDIFLTNSCFFCKVNWLFSVC